MGDVTARDQQVLADRLEDDLREAIARRLTLEAEVERLRDLVATLWLYIGRYEVTQLTTEQKELLADTVEAHYDDGLAVERWWRDA